MPCFSHVDSRNHFCLVRHLDELKDVNGEPIVNEFECPLLQLKPDLYLIPTTSIISPISIVHSCDSSCTFINSTTERHIEREPVDIQKLTFCHNLMNYIYLLQYFLYQ